MNKKTKIKIALSFTSLCAATALFACYSGMSDSVHFYSAWMGEVVDFGMPPQERMFPNYNNALERGATNRLSDNYWIEERQRNEEKYRLNRARNEDARGNYDSATRLFRSLKQFFPCESFLQDRLEVLNEASASKDTRGLSEYLRIRYLEEFVTPGGVEAKYRALAKGNVAPYLKAHIAYALAFYQTGRRAKDVDAFLSVAHSYPSSPRAEAALIMAARTCLSDYEPQPTPELIDKGSTTLDELLQKYPKTRFRVNALNWKGRVAFLKGDTAKALDIYRKIEKEAGNAAEEHSASESLRIIYRAQGRADLVLLSLLDEFPQEVGLAHEIRDAMQDLTTETAALFQKALRKSPSRLSTYLTFRDEFTRLDDKNIPNLIAFADSCLKTMPKDQIDGNIAARIAQMAYEIRKYKSSQNFVNIALASKHISEDNKSRASYLAASLLVRNGKTNAAISKYESFLKQWPKGYLAEGVREQLALLYERTGHYDKALDTYIELKELRRSTAYEYSGDYRPDIAYIADVIMASTQVKRYLASRKANSMTTTLQVQVGIKLMREGHYAEAETWLKRIPGNKRARFGLSAEDYKDHSTYMNDEGLADPYIAAQAFAKADRKIRTAKTTEQTAQARYDLAAEIYNRRNLAFYNFGLWRGDRAWLRDAYWNDTVNTKKDDAAWHTYAYQHECLAQAAKMCDDIIRKYPKSKVIPKALYTGAVAKERLSNLNVWWREEAEKQKLLKKSVAMLRRLVKEYPKSFLAKDAKKYARVFQEMADDGDRSANYGNGTR